MKLKTIIIANIAEAFEDIIHGIKSPAERNRRVQIEHNLCERTLLWEEDDKLVITPLPISEEIFKKNSEILGLKNVRNLFPSNIDISLSDAIMHDKKLLNVLSEIISNNTGVTISPYCVTDKFLSLVNYFKSKGLKFAVTEKPIEYADWLVKYLDSKIGSRVEIGKIKDKCFTVPDSIICKGKEESIDAVLWFLGNKKSCVLKANFGESGWGLIIVRKEGFQCDMETTSYLNNEFKKDSIWNENLILAEEYICPNQSLAKSPSSELFISNSGAEITYICDQILGNDGDFLGVVLGKGVLDYKLKRDIKKASLLVGKRFWQMGYRGFFDIDFVISKDELPYIIETNMRRTGGTHVYDVARSIFGKKWNEEAFLMSCDNFQYGKRKISDKKIIDKMRNVMYPIEGKREGVIISILHKSQPKLGFIIVGDNKNETLDIYNKMLNIWSIK